MGKPKFYGGYKADKPAQLSLGISLDNPTLWGENVKVFVSLANRHKKFISDVLIFIGDEQYACYVGEKEAKKKVAQWKKQSTQYLNALDIPYKVVCSKSLTQTEEGQVFYQTVKKGYLKNTDNFKTVVDETAKDFIKNKPYSLESAIDYLLKECPMYLVLKGKTTYPKAELNDVLTHVINKYKPDGELTYVGYSVGNKKLNQPISNKQFNRLVLEKVEQQSQEMSKLTNEVAELKQQIAYLCSVLTSKNQAPSDEMKKIQESNHSPTLF